jgi:hypothetical protein
MLWLYGVAWHQPMAESIAWARTTIAEAIPSAGTLTGGFAGGAGSISGLPPPSPSAAPPPLTRAAAPVTALPPAVAPVAARSSEAAPIDPDIAVMFAERKSKVAW